MSCRSFWLDRSFFFFLVIREVVLFILELVLG